MSQEGNALSHVLRIGLALDYPVAYIGCRSYAEAAELARKAAHSPLYRWHEIAPAHQVADLPRLFGAA